MRPSLARMTLWEDGKHMTCELWTIINYLSINPAGPAPTTHASKIPLVLLLNLAPLLEPFDEKTISVVAVGVVEGIAIVPNPGERKISYDFKNNSNNFFSPRTRSSN